MAMQRMSLSILHGRTEYPTPEETVLRGSFREAGIWRNKTRGGKGSDSLFALQQGERTNRRETRKQLKRESGWGIMGRKV